MGDDGLEEVMQGWAKDWLLDTVQAEAFDRSEQPRPDGKIDYMGNVLEQIVAKLREDNPDADEDELRGKFEEKLMQKDGLLQGYMRYSWLRGFTLLCQDAGVLRGRDAANTK